MKQKGITILEFLILLGIIGLLMVVTIPSILTFRCRVLGNNLGLDRKIVNNICTDCTNCNKKNITPLKALHMIKDGINPSIFMDPNKIEVISSQQGELKTTDTQKQTPKNTEKALENKPIRSWKD